MLTPEQILEIARAHCFYPDSDLTALVRTIEKAAEAAAIERCAKACEDYAKERRPDTWSLSGEGEALGAEVCAERIRTLLNSDGE